ncbi:insulinase family protein [Chloroflexi bacterium TSY]|nr:insulinase family protein [Chloroflexi bacterium TSY]
MTLRIIPILIASLLFSACTGLQLLPQETNLMSPESSESASVDAAAFDASAYPADEPLPIDPQIRKGVLDNGFTYYIRHNEEPSARASLWLAVNAGSNQEDEDQLGIAHFLEHLLFEGTESFPEGGIIEFLESVGMEYGPDTNARTSFDETVYTIQIPTDDPDVVDTGLQIMEEWAAHALLDADEVEAERGIIVEEWRLRQESATGRITEQTIPFIFADSRYAERLPIGDMDIVRSVPPERIRDFYETWYRPDLMAIFAIGDFDDLDRIEEQIIDRFSDMITPADAQPRESYIVPFHDDTRIKIITDPEQTRTRIQLLRKMENVKPQTPNEFRQEWAKDLSYQILNERLDEIAREVDAPFLSAGGGNGTYVRTVAVDFMSIQVEDEKIAPGLEAFAVEAERADRYGFTESELERAKINFLQSYERSYNERANRDNESYASEYLRNFFTDESIPGIEVEFGLAQAIIPEITLEEVNAYTGDLVNRENRVVTITAPEKDDVTPPTEDELATIFENVMTADIEPFEEEVVEGELLATIPDPVEVVSEMVYEEVGITEIVLANGVRVLMKPTDFKDDEIVFNAVSPGGSSLVSDEDFPEASTIADVITQSGLGAFDQTALEKLLTGKTATVIPYIREISEGMDGSSSVDDLETMFQLIYLYATQPRIDEDAFEVFRTQLRAALVNRAASPRATLGDALSATLYGETIRRGALPLEEVDALDLARGFEIYKDRFANMGDFAFSFTGSFAVEELTRLARIYLGNLPTIDREETWQDVIDGPPTEAVETTVYKGEGEQSVVYLIFPAPYDPSPENALDLEALKNVLDTRVRLTIREEMGAAYSSGAFAATREQPDQFSLMYVYFVTDPERVDELVDVTFDIVEDVQTNGVDDELTETTKALELAADEENLEDNGYWLNAMKEYVIYPGKDLNDILTAPERINALTADGIQSVAQEVIDTGRYARIVLLPEAMEGE